MNQITPMTRPLTPEERAAVIAWPFRAPVNRATELEDGIGAEMRDLAWIDAPRFCRLAHQAGTPPGPRHDLNEMRAARRARVAELALLGWTVTAIANEIGAVISTISADLKFLGIERKQKDSKARRDERVKAALRMAASGLEHKDIGVALGVSAHTVRRYLDRAGVPGVFKRPNRQKPQ